MVRCKLCLPAFISYPTAYVVNQCNYLWECCNLYSAVTVSDMSHLEGALVRVFKGKLLVLTVTTEGARKFKSKSNFESRVLQ